MGNKVLKVVDDGELEEYESDLEYNERMSYMDENPLSSKELHIEPPPHF